MNIPHVAVPQDKLFFFVTLLPASLCANMIGPPRTNLLLEQIQGDTDAASSLMGCMYTLFGSFGMIIIATNAVNKVVLLGALYSGLGLITLISWLIVSRQSFVLHSDYHK